MPRIKRYHPISHEFNRDPEVQDLRRQSADWMGYVWLEMLAIADKNNGHIKGTIDELARGLAWLSLSDRPSFSRGKIEVGIRFMLEKGWIKDVTGSFLVCKYPDYHKTREQTKSYEGTKQVPSFLPSEPSDPNQPSERKNIPPPLSGASENGFQVFWSRYPKQEGYGKAQEAWRKHAKGVPLETILAGVARWEVSQKWADGYVPMPATWLNQTRWKDNPKPGQKQFVTAQEIWDQAQEEEKANG